MSGNSAFAHRTLRAAIAFAFLYPPIAAVFDPLSWEGYFPAFVHAFPVPIIVTLHVFGILEVVIALWILSGWRIRLPALAAAALLFAIVAFNFSQLDVLFRDLSIAAIALTLVLWPAPQAEYP